MILAAAILMSAQVASVPPPPEQVRANCAAPTYATDQLVCADAELMARDSEMAALLPPAGERARVGVPSLIEAQGDWLKRRSLCAFKREHRSCALAAYRERIAVLGALAAPPPAAPTYRCTAKWITRPVSGEFNATRQLVLSNDTHVTGVAFASAWSNDWQAFAIFTGDAKRLTIKIGGQKLACDRA